MEYTADIEDEGEDVQPQYCFNCQGLVSWIPLSQTVDATAQCERCLQLPSNLERNEAHLQQVRQLREAGELGEEFHFCWTCESQPCRCMRCNNCAHRNSPRYSRCVNCDRSLAGSPQWFTAGQAIVYCDQCGAPEDDCHCEEEICDSCGYIDCRCDR